MLCACDVRRECEFHVLRVLGERAIAAIAIDLQEPVKPSRFAIGRSTLLAGA
jgi:hypothetical protein